MFFGVKFWIQEMCLCKQINKYQECHDHYERYHHEHHLIRFIYARPWYPPICPVTA